MEADCMDAKIESDSKFREEATQRDWIQIFQAGNGNGVHIVRKMTQEDSSNKCISFIFSKLKNQTGSTLHFQPLENILNKRL